MTIDTVNQQKKPINIIALIILLIITIVSIVSAILSLIYPEIVSLLSGANYVSGGAIYDAIYVMLTIATDALYIIGGAAISFGAIFITVRFIQVKLKDPFQPTFSSHKLSGYLTLGLNFFIGAEIIRTVAVRTYEEFVLLILTIISRALLTGILYLEERWHSAHDTD